ncbi:MAG: glycoside hydrolase family 127 protein [Prevotella sp.]|nr:glycoside hydrolase family 127 protein [Prevotella sp.]
MIKSRLIGVLAVAALLPLGVDAQTRGLTDMSASKMAVMENTPMGAVKWTGGFWGERFGVLADKSAWDMWSTWNDPKVSHGFRNFEVAAGTVEGVHHGPPFHDGDLYKWLEGVASVYAVTRDPRLDTLMDKVIKQIALAQRADGYIHTPVVISERNKGIDSHAKDHTVIGIEIGKDHKKAFESRLNFETYNLGHLMTAGIVHHRVTGKTTLLDCGRKAADFLYDFLKSDAAELSRNAICPSHYMGAAEMWRETGNAKYLDLVKGLIGIRDSVKNGEDHNQDRIPFRQQYEAMGHAVRANYLYAGVADLYAETGEAQLMKNLASIWDDITYKKIYITGGCGALYDGVSPDGTTYNQPSIQQIHQAYGRQYQLPNEASHNETCAQIGHLLFSWRLFQTTGEAKYVEMIENELYNGILSGISLDGTKYFYTQALRKSHDFPYTMRWPKERQRYISCFCCPPNTFRTLVQAQEYAYSVSPRSGASATTLWVNVYGENALKTKDLEVEQKTGYPYDGDILLTIRKAKSLQSLRLRIPEWCDEASLTVNGQPVSAEVRPNSYVTINRKFKKGDVVALSMPMRARLIEAHPLVEDVKNQVAVKRGPIVYCLESADIDGSDVDIDDVVIPANIELTPVDMTIDGHPFKALEGTAHLAKTANWAQNELYREVKTDCSSVKVRLIPYYAWGNRGNIDMTVWMPLAK